MAIKAVLFDMDGTIADTEPYHVKAIQEILKEELNLRTSEDEIGEYIGLVYEEKLKNIFKKRRINKDVHELSNKIRKRYIKSVERDINLFSGTKDLFKRLKKNKFLIGLVSSGVRKDMNIVMKATNSKKYFDVTIAGDEVENKKPDPECYLKAAEKLHINPEECVVVEDSIPGVEAAKNAGMFCIAVPNKYIKNGDFSKADIVVDGLNEIDLDLIKGLE